MNKTQFLQFLDLYHLGGLINLAKLTVKDNVLSTSFVADDKSMAGSVTMKSFPYEDIVFGISDTTELKSLFKMILTPEVTMSATKKDDKPISMTFTAGNGTDLFVSLAELAIIAPVPKIKVPADFEVEITLDEAFITQYIAAKNSLSEVNTFTLKMNETTGKLQLIVGWAPTINANRAAIAIKTVSGKDTVTDPISFDAKYFREILAVNAGSKTSTFKVSTKGIAVVSFETDDFSTNYFLVQRKLEA